eukprot:Skav206338  [mRNA]  locus=scaffold1420:487316:498005:- [translate_table: standard]
MTNSKADSSRTHLLYTDKFHFKALHATTSREDISVVFDNETTAEMTEIRAHSLVLMLASEVFQKMLTHEMKEKNTRQIHLPGKCPEEFKVLLKFLQPLAGRLQKISMDNVSFLMKWAHEYGIGILETECVDFMYAQQVSEENLDFLLKMAEDYGLDKLKSKCLEFIKTLEPTMSRVVQAHALGLHDYVERCIRVLLQDRVIDWKLCYDHPDLVQKVLELHLMVAREQCFVPRHVHKKGKLDWNHVLASERCSAECSHGWQCGQCRYRPGEILGVRASVMVECAHYGAALKHGDAEAAEAAQLSASKRRRRVNCVPLLLAWLLPWFIFVFCFATAAFSLHYKAPLSSTLCELLVLAVKGPLAASCVRLPEDSKYHHSQERNDATINHLM